MVNEFENIHVEKFDFIELINHGRKFSGIRESPEKTHHQRRIGKMF